MVLQTVLSEKHSNQYTDSGIAGSVKNERPVRI